VSFSIHFVLMKPFRTITLLKRLLPSSTFSWVHSELAAFYPKIGRPSIDPVLMIRMLVVGYAFAIRSERALCREVQVNLAYRWFCGLSRPINVQSMPRSDLACPRSGALLGSQ
jgi:hypothetical protein